MKVSVLLPTGGPPCEWRERARRYVLEHYARHHPDWQVIAGYHGEPWNKPAAVNAAFRQSDGDVLIVADADSHVSPEALHKCLEVVGERWAMPHGTVYRLSQANTLNVYAGGEPDLTDLARPAHRGVPGGGIVVCRRDTFIEINGMDERFEGWGMEDFSFADALDTFAGNGIRFREPFIHLWHPPYDINVGAPPANRDLRHRYAEARADDRKKMAALVAEHAGIREVAPA